MILRVFHDLPGEIGKEGEGHPRLFKGDRFLFDESHPLDVPDLIRGGELEVFRQRLSCRNNLKHFHFAMRLNLAIGQFFIKAGELIDVVIDALFFDIGSAALDALNDLLIGEQL